VCRPGDAVGGLDDVFFSLHDAIAAARGAEECGAREALMKAAVFVFGAVFGLGMPDAGCGAGEALGQAPAPDPEYYRDHDLEYSLITEAKWRLTRNVFIKLNNGLGLTSKATDWSPEVGILLTFPRR
jgi:hypothetical protein